MPEIIIIDTRKPQETKSVLLVPEQQLNQECLIGRDDRCCIVLQDSLTSRTHGKITFREGNYYYSDLGSRNGSKVNNIDTQLNQEYLLKPSDTIAMGNHLLWIKAIARKKSSAASPTLTPSHYMPLAVIDTSSLETWTQGTKQVKCAQIVDETADAKTFIFICEPPVKFDYQPGQFVTLGLNINGKNIKCSYSISSTPSRPHSLEITVKRSAQGNQPNAPQGLVSNWLHDNLRVGSQIKIYAPMGKFTNFAHPSAKVLLISADNGIAPMMSMSRWICDTVSKVDTVFLHSAPSPQDIIFRQELEMMTARYPNFKLAITVTRPVPGQPWYGYTGQIDENMLSAIAADYKERTVYVSGSESFIEVTKELLQKLNFPMENYYEESLAGAKKKATPTVPAGEQPILKEDASDNNDIATLGTSIIQPANPPNAKPVSNPTTLSVPTPNPKPAPDSTTLSVPTPNPKPAPDSTTLSVPTPNPKPAPDSTTLSVPTPNPKPVSDPTTLSVPTPNPKPAPPPISTPITPPTVSPTSIVGFDSPPPVAASAPSSTPTSTSSSSVIVLSKSGQEISCDGEEAILDVAEAEGADLPFGCRMGACGACKVRKIEGKVIYDDDIDCEDGFVYTCIARPVGKVTIEA